MSESPETSLDNLGNGSAVERFNYELKKVLENILDPNTDYKAKRAVSLTVTFQPNAERDALITAIDVKSKVAPIRQETTTLYVGHRHGEVIATEYNPRQERMNFDQPSQSLAIREID